MNLDPTRPPRSTYPPHALVHSLNGAVTLASLAADAAEIGYPMAAVQWPIRS